MSKFIDPMVAASLSGSNWHIEKGQTPSKYRRSKRKCAFYTKEKCIYTLCKCISTVVCDSYTEDPKARDKYLTVRKNKT